MGEGDWGEGEGGRGHFVHLAMYCTTTWCFALKGLPTTMTHTRSAPNHHILTRQSTRSLPGSQARRYPPPLT